MTVVLHGFTGSAEAMAPLTSRLSGRVIAVDLVGHGRSPAPDNVEPYRVDAQLEQLDGVIAGHESVRLVGYSMGARLALSYAVAHPNRVASLGLLGARAGIEDASDRAARVAADERLAASIEKDGVATFAVHWAGLSLFESQSPAVQEKQHAVRLNQRAHGLANSLRGFGAGAMPPLFDHLGLIECPVTLITGALDLKFTALAEQLLARLPNASREVVPNVGHAAHLEDVGRVIDALQTDG